MRKKSMDWRGLVWRKREWMKCEQVEHEVRLEGRVGNEWTVGGRWRRRGKGW